MQISNAKLSEIFSEASRASILGHHRIVISRQLSKWAIENLDLATREKEHINKIGQAFSQLARQVDEANYKILVRPDATEITHDNNGTWIIGLDHALPDRLLSQTSLVLENANHDGEFYELIFQLNAKLLGFGELSYVPIHGGGNGSAEEIKRISALGKPVSCICDTDLKAPGGAASATYNAVMTVKNNINAVGAISGTPVREIENFLPPSIVGQITEKTETLDYINELLKKQKAVSSGDCLWLYIDIKDGFKPGVLDAYCKSEKTRKWVSEKFNLPDDEIKNISIDSLGTNILSYFMASSSMKGELHQYIRSDYWRFHFLDWTNKFMWALAGRKRERSG